jgi:hypothetical protein
MDRRHALKTMGAGTLGLGAVYGLPGPALERFARALRAGTYQLAFFTADEAATVRVLADMIIPADERSGSASEAGTVEYMDFVLSESDAATQELWRFGLTWLDDATRGAHGVPFVDASPAQRGEVLDLVAWPERAAAVSRRAVEWFTRARDLVGSGFFSSRIGVEDIGYVGGYVTPGWSGAPPEALEELGVSYAEWDRRYGGNAP